uniref:RNA pol Rpc4 n=1 Tax=Tremella fuciformis TaxID=64657 RepID=D5KY36_9TREE|nr:RNA pol Rpc4 [Tremella fuciformis]
MVQEEPDMEGDFVMAPGQDDPQDRLFVFQMPPKMPRFLPTGPIDATANDETKDGVKDVKPSTQALKGKKKAQPPPDGRIGTLVVMKSGKVKLVMGQDIVMNVIPGANDHFLSHLVHIDKPHKSATVLGEVFRQYHLEPDVDSLLQQLQMHNGETPGDKAAELQKLKAAVKLEKGLVKMENEL